jgi:DNA polymerase-3 subunit delta'
VATLSHPDLHWFIPVETSKKGGDADKQIEVVEEALGEELARRRAKPLYPPPSGLANHGIASVRLLLRRLALTPVVGGMKVFVVGDAERLVPQIGSEQAANALLKSLEEPPLDTQFVLTTADADALLPTILSRVVRIRLQRVPDRVVTAFVQQELRDGQTPAAIEHSVTVADGCPGRLIAQQGAGKANRSTADALLSSVSGESPARYVFALRQKPFEARGAFSDMLSGLLERLRSEARSGGDTTKLVAAIAHVMDAREMAQGNVNPQLVTAVLADDLARVS